MAEVHRLPAGMLEQIVEDRVIGRAIATYKQNPKASGEYVDLVKQIEFEAVHAELNDAQQFHH